MAMPQFMGNRARLIVEAEPPTNENLAASNVAKTVDRNFPLIHPSGIFFDEVQFCRIEQ